MNYSAPEALATRPVERAPHRYKVLIVVTHVVQYASPIFRRLSQDPRLEIKVAYCSLQGAEAGMDPEFGIEVRWDVPLLDGYDWVQVANKSPRPGLGKFFGLWNPGLWGLIRNGGFDAVVIYTGYMYASFWWTVLAAKVFGVPILISSDSTSVQPRDRARWKERIKPFILGRVYRTIDVLMAGSPAVLDLAVKLGMPESRVQVIRSGVIKEDWVARLQEFDSSKVRASWNVPENSLVVFYCAKLQEWKRPLDLLQAFASGSPPDSYLVFAGDGPQRNEVEQQARLLGVADRVRVLGFVNQSALPGMYKASDIFVLPSAYDPCPLVVPEAMFSGVPVILSDSILGRLDMIRSGESGFVYRSGDTKRLAEILREVLNNRELLEHLKAGVKKQMKDWSLEEFLNCWVGAVERAVERKTAQKRGA